MEQQGCALFALCSTGLHKTHLRLPMQSAWSWCQGSGATQGAMRRAAAAVVNHDTVNQASQIASAAPVVAPVDPGLSAHIATVLDAAQHAAHQVKTVLLLSV